MASGYNAFISYSQLTDKALAVAIQNGLQSLGSSYLFRFRAMEIFRDETAAGKPGGLKNKIYSGIDQSEFMVLLANPVITKPSTESDINWIEEEINYWLASKHKTEIDQNVRIENLKIIICITGGKIKWNGSDFDWTVTDCLPGVLSNRFSQEPEWVDFQEIVHKALAHQPILSLEHPLFKQKIAEVSAQIQNKTVDELIADDRKKRKAWRAFFIVIGIILATLSLLTFIYSVKAKRNENDALRQRDSTAAALHRETLAKEQEATAKRVAEDRRKEAEQQRKIAEIESNRAKESETKAVSALRNESIQRKKADSMQVVTVIERNRALEAFGRKELTDIRLLRESPINHQRTLKLKNLLSRLNPIRTSSIADSVRELYRRIPDAKNIKAQIKVNGSIVALIPNARFDSVAVVSRSGAEIIETKNFRSTYRMSIHDIPNRSQNSGIGWAQLDAGRNRILFEVGYLGYALKNFDKREIIWLDTEKYPSFGGKGIEKLVNSEKELFSLGFDGSKPTFEGITQNVSIIDQYRDDQMPREVNYRGQSWPRASFYNNKPDWDKSEEVKSLGEEGKLSLVHLLAFDLQSGAGIYQVSKIAEEVAISGPLPFLQKPFVYTVDKKLIPIPLGRNYQAGSRYNERGFEPAALLHSQGLAFLNNRLIKYANEGNYSITELTLPLGDVDQMNFTFDGTRLIIIEKNRDIRVVDIKSGDVHTFLAINSPQQALISPDGIYVYLISWDGQVEVWDITVFDSDGWATK